MQSLELHHFFSSRLRLTFAITNCNTFGVHARHIHTLFKGEVPKPVQVSTYWHFPHSRLTGQDEIHAATSPPAGIRLSLQWLKIGIFTDKLGETLFNDHSIKKNALDK